MDRPEHALNVKAIMTMIMTLFLGKNQFAANFEAEMSRKGKPIKEIT